MTPIATQTTDLLTVADAAARRRSIRAFESAPIPEEDLIAIFETVRLAPSAYNVQPWRFVVVREPALKRALARAANGQRQVESAPAVVVLYTDMEDALATVDEVIHPGIAPERRAAARDGTLEAFARMKEEQLGAWGAGQGYIALGYLLLAAESRGYQTSPMLGFDPKAVAELLGLPAGVRIPALVAIGKGTEAGYPHHRHGLDRLVRWE